jgi:hypothetical protein
VADSFGLNDVSTKDTGSGSKLKTGGRRSHNMPKACVDRMIKAGKSPQEAQKLCYPKGKDKETLLEKMNKGVQPSAKESKLKEKYSA